MTSSKPRALRIPIASLTILAAIAGLAVAGCNQSGEAANTAAAGGTTAAPAGGAAADAGAATSSAAPQSQAPAGGGQPK